MQLAAKLGCRILVTMSPDDTTESAWRAAIISSSARNRRPYSWRFEMKSQVIWLRVAFWAGAVAGAYVAFTMLFPQPGGHPDFSSDWGFRYAMAFGAALMVGWTVLLIWADRKPLERRGILVITVFPVIVGLQLSKLVLHQAGLISNPFPLSSFIVPSVLSVLFLGAYANSFRRIAGS